MMTERGCIAADMGPLLRGSSWPCVLAVPAFVDDVPARAQRPLLSPLPAAPSAEPDGGPEATESNVGGPVMLAPLLASSVDISRDR